MKKLVILTSFLFMVIVSHTQTLKIEEENLTRSISNSNLSAEEARNKVNEWKQFLNDYGDYPNLPYNEASGEIEYTFLKDFGFKKDILMNRIFEWAALNFGSLDAALHYKDLESGKIILKGYFPISHKEDFRNFWGTKKESINFKDCYCTYLLTVKDYKLKMQIIDIKIEDVSPAYSFANSYIPERKFKYPLNALYPISSNESIKWKENLNILEKVNNRINGLTEGLYQYINNYSNDYSF